METKHFLIEELKATEDGEEGYIEGWASTFGNVDAQKDIVLPGAFAKSIQGRASKVKMLWQHKQDMPIGVWTEMRETPQGLYVKGKLLLKTALGRDAYEMLKAGAIDQMSIGYATKSYDIDRKTGVRSLKEVELHEVSLVTFPANDKARITDVKSAPQTLREFEEFLREEGKFSREQATTIALRGFKSLDQGEPVPVLTNEEVEGLKSAFRNVLTA